MSHPRHNRSAEPVLSLLFAAAFLGFNALAAAFDVEEFKTVQGELNIICQTDDSAIIKEACRRVAKANYDLRVKLSHLPTDAELTPDQLKQADVIVTTHPAPVENGVNAKSVPFAALAVALAVHPDNPVNEISHEQLARIYSGLIVNWKELNGPDLVITKYLLDQDTVAKRVFSDVGLLNKTPTLSAVSAANERGMKAAISFDKQAIGPLNMVLLDKSVKALALDGVTPGVFTVTTGKYPLASRLYLNLKPNPSLLSRFFLKYLKSPEGRKIIRQCQHIPLE